MRAFLTFLSLLMLVGCTQQRVATPSVSEPDTSPYSDMRPAGDPRFTADEQRMVAAARAHVETFRQPLDARYQVERTADGYKVLVRFVGGYENGRPLYFPGGHGIVVLRSDGTFVRYLPGE